MPVSFGYPFFRSTQHMAGRRTLCRLVAAVIILGMAWWCVPRSGKWPKDRPIRKRTNCLRSGSGEALTQKNYPLATTRFRDVVNRFAKTPSATPARFWLAVCLIDGHDKNYKEALDLLDAVADTTARDVDLQRS